MSKWLIVGDVHAVTEDLDDCQGLIDGIEKVALGERPESILFLGDLFHNHGIISVDVLSFWRKALTQLSALTPVKVLVGNHDRPGDHSNSNHALVGLRGIDGVEVVDKPTVYDDCVIFPFTGSEEVFQGWLKEYPQTIVFAHQTFEGATYDNGFYAKDAFSLKGAEDRKIVSGHIHKPAAFSNVTYIGAPRWKNVSDAEVELRSISIIDTSTGRISKTFPTDNFCQRIIKLVDSQSQPNETVLNPKWKYIVDIYGSQSYIQERQSKWAGCRIRTFKTQTKTKQVSESMGIGKALGQFVENYSPKHGTSIDKLKTMLQERIQL
jgi:hypothetical protein